MSSRGGVSAADARRALTNAAKAGITARELLEHWQASATLGRYSVAAMSDLNHRVFQWRPQIRSRREAKAARAVLAGAAQGLAVLDQAETYQPQTRRMLEAQRALLVDALDEWHRLPPWTRLRGRTLEPDRVELERWIQHVAAYAHRYLATDGGAGDDPMGTHNPMEGP